MSGRTSTTPRRPRHKSCSACISMKRKCDRSMPRCRRCEKRGSQCVYPSLIRSNDEHHSLLTGVDEIAQPLQQIEDPLNESLQTPLIDAPVVSCSTLWLHDLAFEFPNHPFNLGSTMSPESSLAIPQFPTSDASVDGFIDPRTMISHRDTHLQARVQFVAKRLANLPRQFAEEAQTMFIHRMQFQDTCFQPVQDAMSAAALYSLRNDSNRSIVFEYLQQKASSLTNRVDHALASTASLLAALQALILLQIMRLFDGDISLRARAELDQEVLVRWTSELTRRMCAAMGTRTNAFALTTPDQLNASTTADWYQWLLDESIRRTILTSLLLKGVYDYLKLGYDSAVDVRVFFTAQQATWHAQSYLGWLEARNATHRLEIAVVNWDADISFAQPHDLDELGVLIMNMLWGSKRTQA